MCLPLAPPSAGAEAGYRRLVVLGADPVRGEQYRIHPPASGELAHRLGDIDGTGINHIGCPITRGKGELVGIDFDSHDPLCPASAAPITAAAPTPPMPSTITASPGWTRATFTAAPTPVDTPQETRADTAGSTPSGISPGGVQG